MRQCFLTLAAVLAVWQLAPQGEDGTVQAQDAAGWGTVKGRIAYAGDAPPKRDALKVDKDKEVCLAHGPVLDESWVVDPKSKGVRDVFIWLEDPSGNALPIHPSLKDPKTKEVVIDQPQCQFIPHAVGLRQGQVLVAKNSAPIVHNFKWTGHPAFNPGGNVIIPAGGKADIKDLKADKLPIQVACNIHPWMVGWVRVYDHPYYVVTGKDGTFEIKNAPAGNYVMKVWHGGSGWLGGAKGKAGQPITIKANGTTDLGDLKIGPAKAS